MVGNDPIVDSGYVMLGAATDSLVMVLAYSGAVTFLVLMVGVFIGTRSEEGVLRWLKIKPLLIPSFTFVITLFLVIALIPHPMADYHGLNEAQIQYYTGDHSTHITLYDGIAYQSAVDIHVVCTLEESESTTINVDFKQDGEVITSQSISLNGNALSPTISDDTFISIQPGQYDVEVSWLGVHYYTVTLSQPLVSGFFNEVLAWESYKFLLIAGSFFFILGGLCIGKEKRTRFRQEEVDEEPPKDGAAYARQFVG